MYSNKALKIVISVLCVAIVSIFFAYYFIYIDIKNKNENHHRILYDLSFHDVKQSYLVNTGIIIKNLNSEISHTNNSIIAKEGEVLFIEDLERIATENNLEMFIESLVFEQDTKSASSSIEILQIKVKTRGTWAGNYAFLSRIESLPHKIRINKFDIVNQSAQTNGAGGNPNSIQSVWQGFFEIAVLKYK